MTASWMAANWLWTSQKNSSYFADFEQVIKISSYYATLSKSKKSKMTAFY